MPENPIIFIVGNSRSGTTLMARILSRHPDVHILNETHFIEEFAAERNSLRFEGEQLKSMINKMFTIQRKDYYRKAETEQYPETESVINELSQLAEISLRDIIRSFFVFEANRLGKSIPGDQTPRHVFYINEIKKMFPEALFINMSRDPRGVLLSQKYKWKAGIRLKVPLYETIRTYLNYHPILMAIMWRKGIKSALSACERIGPEEIINVKFEHLVNDPENSIKMVCDFLGVKYHHSMIDVPVSMSSTSTDEGKRGISKNVAEKWTKSLSATDVYFAEKINGELMEVLGYAFTHMKPNPLKLLFFWVVLPFQAAVIFALNLNRMGNPVTFIKKRFG